jgi:hypothetical protein
MNIESGLTLGQQRTKRILGAIQGNVEEAKKRPWEEFGKQLQDHFSKNS